MRFTFKKLGIEITDECRGVEEFFQKTSFYKSLPDLCGGCGEGNISPQHRTYDGNDYYSLVCLIDGCNFELKLGQYKKGGLFIKDDGKWVPPFKKKFASKETSSDQAEAEAPY